MTDRQGFSEHLPEARTLWTRYRPKGWGGAPGPWFDLVDGGLGGGLRGAAPRVEDVAALDDLVYLPPPGRGDSGLRDELAAAAIEYGLRPVVQVGLEDPLPSLQGSFTLLIDSLPALLAAAPAGSGGEGAVWLLPAIPGLTAGESAQERVCARLVELSASAVHVYEPRLGGSELRRLAELFGGDGFEHLFHGEPVDGTPLMRSARRAGLEVLRPRPAAGVAGRAAENRVLSGLLSQAADLWLRAGRPPSAGQVLFRAAREVDRTAFDLRALAREGNLRVLEWLAEPAGALVDGWLATGAAPLLDDLAAEVLGAPTR
ncbi:MAG TPA: hypothetical protein VMT85_19165 [Thermoanaerobaculia bacterium]|nr:hypothetical protein [Thermoanaerobaculia bacterium]